MPALRNFAGERGAAAPHGCLPHRAAWLGRPPLTLRLPHVPPRARPLCAAVCASLAVLLDFLLQVTAFVALLALDTRRLEQGRYDCAPCLRCAGGGRGAPLWGFLLLGGKEEVARRRVGGRLYVG
jgi:hypothetical protein